MNILIKILASWFGSGYFPVSGTVASLAALIVFAVVPDTVALHVILLAAVTILSVPVSTRAEILYGKKDDSHIVIDEVVGMWLSVIALPRTVAYYAAAFFLFRAFDVIKPLFIRKVQDWPGGWGIVADDFLAGLATAIIMAGAHGVLTLL